MRGRPPSIREEDLLDAARDVFREEGLAATTAKIAKKAGVSEGILFYRYKSKEALLAAVIHRETQPSESLRSIAKKAGQKSVEQNLEAIIEAILDTVCRAYPFLELAETSPSSSEVRRILFSKSRRPPPVEMVELVAGYFEREAALGRLRKVNGVAIGRAVFGGCVDFIRSRELLTESDDRAAFVAGLLDVLLNGAAKPSQRAR
jgi:AcrR family transcriptional regulator